MELAGSDDVKVALLQYANPCLFKPGAHANLSCTFWLTHLQASSNLGHAWLQKQAFIKA